MTSPLFVAIGVHRAAKLAQLDGVLTSVKALSGWAGSHGYDVVTIDDTQDRVTVARIKDALTPVNAATGDRDPKRLLDRSRIVVYFCGHGLHAPQDQYWILSAGPDQPNDRISAVGFRDMLTTYQPKQIAFISDSCRSAQVVHGLASSVVDAYEGQAVRIAQKDNFFSSQDGQESFAVPSKNGAPAYCVFSSVLTRALSEPPNPKALDGLYLETGRMIVSSQSLADYLEYEVPQTALGVGKWQVPQCDPGFRPVNNHYVDFGLVSGAGSHFRARAEARQAAIATGREAAQNKRIDRSRSEWRGPYIEHLQKLMGPVLVRSLAHHQRGPLLLSSNSDVPHVQAPSVRADAPLAATENLPRWNLLVSVDRGFAESERSSVAVVRMADLFTVLPLHHRLWCTAIINKRQDAYGAAGGVELLAWGERYSSPTPRLTAAEALKGLSGGTLNAEDTAILATDMRYLKHADPMYGIVAAYLYNAIGDVSNIRRMCYYYRKNGQDVPFDIAMLAQLKLEKHANGGFYVKVPKVAELPAAQRHPNAPDFVWERTPTATVDVAGVTPLLRTGWQHIQTSSHAVHQKCWKLTPHLTESPISTFHGHEAGARLVEALMEL
jgi:hypothetical protein